MGNRAYRRTPAVPLVVAAVLSGGCAMLGGPDPRERAAAVAAQFLDAWAEGDVDAAAGVTDDPAAAARDLPAATDDLPVESVSVAPGEVTGCEGDQPCRQGFQVTLELAGLGEWTYASALTLVAGSGGQAGEGERGWLVDWEPAVVHPRLTGGAALRWSRRLPPRAPILDRQDRPITRDREVVTVGIEPRRLTEPQRAYAALEGVGVDAAALAERLAAAEPDHFVEVITLRQEDYAQAALDGIPGVIGREGVRSLAPTSSFARALLGTVGPATAETLAEAGPEASAQDLLGTSGLQRAYQRQLAGTPGGEVTLVRDGEPVEILHRVEPRPGGPLATTLDLQVQAAAERAVAGARRTTALVALDLSTGGVLAAANSPDATQDRAMTGRYPPGSTFKVVSASALLKAGMDPEEPVDCPATTTVGGRTFKNYEFTALGRASFAQAFAASCNTTFVRLAERLPAGALVEAAARLGLGADWDLGVPAYAGSVPEPGDPVDDAAAMIGQSRILTSPLAMATVAAAVASGQPRTPVLLPAEAPRRELDPLPAAHAQRLRTLMRAVVTEGTATALRPHGEVHAKTGTAEFGAESPPRTHAWVIGFRGEVAFAVVVEDGGSGGADAAPVAGRLLAELDRAAR